MISPINFTGIKNIGYARVYSNSCDVLNDYDDSINGSEAPNRSRVVMNMELTDDTFNKDLTAYKKILKERPDLKNTVNDRYVNIDYETLRVNDMDFVRVLFNGILIPSDDNKILQFSKALVDRIANFKIKDIKTDPDQHLMLEAQEGLIYNENIMDYMDGSSGTLDFLEGTDLPKKFDYYLNDRSANLSEDEEEKLFNAIDELTYVLHDPGYVHNGAIYMQALLKGYKKDDLSS